MTPDWQPVSRGLRLILTGAKTVGWSIFGLVAVFGLGCCLLIRTEGNDARVIVLTLFFAALASIAIGRIFCTVGRYLCLRTPVDAPAARATIRLTVILETCGLLTWLSAFAIVFTPFASPEVVISGYGFALLCNIAGRVFFFRYLDLIGQHLQSHSLTEDARRFFRFSITAIVLAVVGTGLLIVGNTTRSADELSRAVQSLLVIGGVLFLSVTASLLLYLLLVYFYVISEAQRIVANYTPPPADDDPDREYRDRYLTSGGTDTDADT
jgi:uncharacterized membrane protein